MIVRFIRPWKAAERKHYTFLDQVISKAINDFFCGPLQVPQMAALQFLLDAKNQILSTKPSDYKEAINKFDKWVKKYNPEYNASINTIPGAKLQSSTLRAELLEIMRRIFNYDNFCEKKRVFWCAYSLYQHCRYIICPYCNIGSIACNYDPYDEDDKDYRGDLDHFLPKETYPFLALSLGNLIPSCTTCNTRFKGRNDPKAKPILNPICDSPNNSFTFTMSSDLSEIKRIAIQEHENDLKDESQESIKTFNLNKRYNEPNVIENANTQLKSLAYACDVKIGDSLLEQLNGLKPTRSGKDMIEHKYLRPKKFKNSDYGRMRLELYKKFIR